MHREQGNLFPMFANCCIVACANHREHPDFLKNSTCLCISCRKASQHFFDSHVNSVTKPCKKEGGKSVPVQLKLMFLGPAISLKSGATSNLSDNILACFRYLSENGASVHISWRRIRDFSWNQKKNIVTSHCQKETTTKK